MPDPATNSAGSTETTSTPFVAVRTADGADFVMAPDRGVAFGRWCPHKQGDLAEGTLVGSAVKCPLHGYMFNLANGRGMNCRYKIDLHPATCDGASWRVADRPVEVVSR